MLLLDFCPLPFIEGNAGDTHKHFGVYIYLQMYAVVGATHRNWAPSRPFWLSWLLRSIGLQWLYEATSGSHQWASQQKWYTKLKPAGWLPGCSLLYCGGAVAEGMLTLPARRHSGSLSAECLPTIFCDCWACGHLWVYYYYTLVMYIAITTIYAITAAPAAAVVVAAAANVFMHSMRQFSPRVSPQTRL